MSFDLFPLTKKLYDRLTQQRANWMDNLQYITSTVMGRLDANVSTRAQESTTAKSSVCTDERLARLDSEVRGIRVIRHYQQSVAGSDAITDVTITAVVDLSKSRVSVSWHQPSSTNPAGSLSAHLLNPTTVRLQHHADAGSFNDKQAYIDVIEYY